MLPWKKLLIAFDGYTNYAYISKTEANLFEEITNSGQAFLLAK